MDIQPIPIINITKHQEPPRKRKRRKGRAHQGGDDEGQDKEQPHESGGGHLDFIA